MIDRQVGLVERQVQDLTEKSPFGSIHIAVVVVELLVDPGVFKLLFQMCYALHGLLMAGVVPVSETGGGIIHRLTQLLLDQKDRAAFVPIGGTGLFLLFHLKII